jgi:hypothetical protein
MKADKYYGAAARNYDTARQGDGTWAAENSLIETLLEHGPVLDVPFGTGRYVPIYQQKELAYLGVDISHEMLAQAKSKYPDATCRHGSIFNLPTGFQTAVCTRILNWLYPEQLRLAMEQLGHAAETLIFSARTGTDGDRRATATYTHSTNTLKQLIGGRLWEQHRIGSLKHGVYIMVKARKPIWQDIAAAFIDRPSGMLDKLAGHWSARIQVAKPQLKPGIPLTVEWWTHTALATYIDDIAKIDPAMVVTRKPRRDTGPLIAFKRDQRYALLDGRYRANLWRNKPGLYPVIVMIC